MLLTACFADVGGGGVDSSDAESTGGAATTTSATTSTTGVVTGSASGGATTVPPDDDSTTESPESSTSSSAESGATEESSSDTGVEGFCASQPSDVVVCYDFDGASPFAGATVWEQHGTVNASEQRAVSRPRSMEVVAIGDPLEVTNASMGRTLAGVGLPFDGEVAARTWLAADCLGAGLGGAERLLMALQFADNADPQGPFLLNMTLWVTSAGATLYASDQGQGFPSQPYPVPIPFPTGEWVDIAIAFDATADLATVTIGDESEMVQVGIVTDIVMDEIADVVPSISIGTGMEPNAVGCTMWFDDVIVSVD